MATQLTDAARRALAILDREGGRLRPKDFAHLMWPDHPAFGDPPVGKPGDVVYTAGGYLGRLRAKGWVDVDPDGATITSAGLEALHAEAAPPSKLVVAETIPTAAEIMPEAVTSHRGRNLRRAKPRSILGGRRVGDEPPNAKHRIEPSTLDADRCKSCLRPIRQVGGSSKASKGYFSHLPGGELPTGVDPVEIEKVGA